MKTERELELESMSFEELEARMNRLQTRLEEIRRIYYRKLVALAAWRELAADK